MTKKRTSGQGTIVANVGLSVSKGTNPSELGMPGPANVDDKIQANTWRIPPDSLW